MHGEVSMSELTYLAMPQRVMYILQILYIAEVSSLGQKNFASYYKASEDQDYSNC